ncbi:MAG: hypothetical protein ABW220_04620, partial [Burkholderiaceae bacterium]
PLASGARLHLMAHFGTQPATGLRMLPGHTLYTTGVTLDEQDMPRLASGAVCITLQEKDTHG